MGEINSGELRHRLIVQERIATLDSRGQIADSATWREVRRVWAKIEPLSGAEIENARKDYAEATHRVTVRATTRLTMLQRLKFGDRYLNIGSISDTLELGDRMELICGEAKT